MFLSRDRHSQDSDYDSAKSTTFGVDKVWKVADEDDLVFQDPVYNFCAWTAISRELSRLRSRLSCLRPNILDVMLQYVINEILTYRHEVSVPPIDITPHESFLWVAASVILWSILYFTLCLQNPNRNLEWHCRTVTVVHATVIVGLSSWGTFVQGPWPFTDPGGQNTPLQHLVCTLALGYFIYDLIWCLYHQTEGFMMLLHHVVSIVGNVIVVYRVRMGTEMIATLFGTELSNPFLQMRYFLREAGKHKTWYGELNDLAFMGLFGFLRTCAASLLLYSYMYHPNRDIVGLCGGVGIYLIGWVFWIMIVKYAINKYTKMYRLYKQSCQDKSIKQNGTQSAQTQNGAAGRKHFNGVRNGEKLISKQKHL